MSFSAMMFSDDSFIVLVLYFQSDFLLRFAEIKTCNCWLNRDKIKFLSYSIKIIYREIFLWKWWAKYYDPKLYWMMCWFFNMSLVKKNKISSNIDSIQYVRETILNTFHGEVIKWKHFPLYWIFVRGIHRSPANSPHKGQWSGALMFSVICVWPNSWVNNHNAGDLTRRRAHMAWL